MGVERLQSGADAPLPSLFIVDLVMTKAYYERMKTATIHQTKTHLSRMLKEIQGGDTIIILNGSTPVAQLTAIEPSAGRRPKVGTRTSPPVQYVSDAFEALNDDQLKEWGL